jgi:hypothetical protein
MSNKLVPFINNYDVYLLILAFFIAYRILKSVRLNYEKNKHIYDELRGKQTEFLKNRFPDLEMINQVPLFDSGFTRTKNIRPFSDLCGKFNFDKKTKSYESFHFVLLVGLPLFPIAAYRVTELRSESQSSLFHTNMMPRGRCYRYLGSIPLNRLLTFKNIMEVYKSRSLGLILFFLIFYVLLFYD